MKYGIWLICFFVLPSAACAGPISAERKSQFEKALGVIISTATPQVSAAVRERLIREYGDAKPNKGQAVQLVDGYYFRFTTNEDQATTGDRTLESCQLRYVKPCALLAVNDEIASEGALISKDMPRLKYAGEFVYLKYL
jgi:hypothetical protein